MIRKGKRIAIGTSQQLKTEFLGAPVIEVQLACALGQPWSGLIRNGLAEQIRVLEYSDPHLWYRTDNPGATNPRFLAKLNEVGAEIVTVAETPQSLEQVYLKLVLLQILLLPTM